MHSGIEVRTGANELPFHTQATLQNIIRDWDRVPQTLALESKLRELAAVQLRISHDLTPLVEDYRKVIVSFLNNRDKSLILGLRRKAAHQHATAVALMQLNALDSQRLALRAPPGPARSPTQTP